MPAVVSSSAGSFAVPPTPPRLSKDLRKSWVGLWSSPVAQLLDPVSDLPAVTRLFQMYQLAERLDVQMGTTGEVDLAAAATRLRVASETRLLEGTLGLSPRARLALGLALLAGRRAGSLDDAVDDADDDD